MNDTLEQYRAAGERIPDTMLAWELYGSGFENLGRDDEPAAIPVPEPAADELLARVDACGLCFSDVKIINLGGDHPRLAGRDLATDPVIPGHEAALTIAAVGSDLADRFKVGERFIVQADITYQGRGLAFGYALPGALAQYVPIGKEILEGDDGCYLLPTRKQTGYAEAALAEPWACVEASYRAVYRTGLKANGITLFLGAPGRLSAYEISAGLDAASHPRQVLLHDSLGPALAEDLAAKGRAADAIVVECTGPIQRLAERHADGGALDDVVILGTPDSDQAGAAAACLARGGILNIVATDAIGGKVAVDVGRIHYEGTYYVGTTGVDIAAAYAARPSGSELSPGGAALFLGAGGPMGQMHVQRALEMEDGPRVVVGTDIDAERLAGVKRRFAPTARQRGARLVCVNPSAMEENAFADALSEATQGRGFDDVCTLVPSAGLIEGADRWLAEHGVMNIFAGIALGTMAELDLSCTYLRGARFVGTSGSAIADLQYTLEKTEAGKLSPNGSVAAIGGINAVKEGLEAVAEGRFPGKIVIFPQIADLPLTALPDVRKTAPEVAEALDTGGVWAQAAEEALLAHHLRGEQGR
ncbi:MAG: alcohol dehydrogenase catalytic domain-containing protein [Armatimonadota bacterium]